MGVGERASFDRLKEAVKAGIVLPVWVLVLM